MKDKSLLCVFTVGRKGFVFGYGLWWKHNVAVYFSVRLIYQIEDLIWRML